MKPNSSIDMFVQTEYESMNLYSCTRSEIVFSRKGHRRGASQCPTTKSDVLERDNDKD